MKPGDHVVCSWLPYCGSCRRCTAGRPVVCERLAVFDEGFLADGTTRFSHTGTRIHHNVPSSFAERSVVPANTVFPVDPSLAARTGRPARMRGHDRRRRGAEHREGAPGRLGPRDRVRRRRALGDPGCADRGCLADRRGRRRGAEARDRQGARRDRDGARRPRPRPGRVRPRHRVPRAPRDHRTGDARRGARRDDRPRRDGRARRSRDRSTRSAPRPRSSRSSVRGTAAWCRRATCRCSRTC